MSINKSIIFVLFKFYFNQRFGILACACLDTSAFASLGRQAHAYNLILFAKERLLAERNAARSFAFVFFSLFSNVNEYSLLSRLKCMLLATLTATEVFVSIAIKRE